MQAQIQDNRKNNFILIDISSYEEEDAQKLANMLRKQHQANTVHLASLKLSQVVHDAEVMSLESHKEEKSDTHVIQFLENYYLDMLQQEVVYKDSKIKLTKREKDFLQYMVENQGEVVTFDEIIEEVWQDTSTTKNTVRNLVCRLRKKFDEEIIKGLPCSGYTI